jgi:cyclophilin family peptidyl-prolyl cis-trans isomerase
VDTTDNRKALVLEKLEESRGIVSMACNNANLSRSQFYQWCKEDSEFKAAVDDINETAIDFVESKLFEKVNGVTVRKGVDLESGEDITYDLPPSDTAIIFYLKTKAKKRGYVERQEITGADGNPLAVNWNESKTYETKD